MSVTGYRTCMVSPCDAWRNHACAIASHAHPSAKVRVTLTDEWPNDFRKVGIKTLTLPSRVTEGWIFFNTIFVSSHMYPENPKGTQVIVGSMNMGYISDTARNRTHNLFRLKREPIPLGHSDGQYIIFHVSWLAIMSVGMTGRRMTGRHRRTGTASFLYWLNIVEQRHLCCAKFSWFLVSACPESFAAVFRVRPSSRPADSKKFPSVRN